MLAMLSRPESYAFDMKHTKLTENPLPSLQRILDSKAHGANMGPTWVLSAPDEPHVGPRNLAIKTLLKLAHDLLPSSYRMAIV